MPDVSLGIFSFSSHCFIFCSFFFLFLLGFLLCMILVPFSVAPQFMEISFLLPSDLFFCFIFSFEFCGDILLIRSSFLSYVQSLSKLTESIFPSQSFRCLAFCFVDFPSLYLHCPCVVLGVYFVHCSPEHINHSCLIPPLRTPASLRCLSLVLMLGLSFEAVSFVLVVFSW